MRLNLPGASGHFRPTHPLRSIRQELCFFVKADGSTAISPASGSATVVIRTVKSPQNWCPWIPLRRTSIVPGFRNPAKCKRRISLQFSKQSVKKIESTYHI
uniref:(northern house mosquito) hypothetical protein n=1 Tax=Culex pipiens TaxID=7175 RepID=A0A8D8FGA0_CULPI